MDNFAVVAGMSLLVCIGLLGGAWGIIRGHRIRQRARRDAARQGAAGKSSGLGLGYAVLSASLLIGLGVVRPGWIKAHERGQRMWCMNSMTILELALARWRMDHGERYPFEVSTNEGGSRELCARDAEGFDRNSFLHFLVLSNELNTPFLLVCPNDTSRKVSANWANLRATNVTYLINSGVDSSNPESVLILCPIHDHVGLYDGSVQGRDHPRKPGL